MQIDDGAIRMDGLRIDTGCSVFHTGFDRVLWFDGVEDGYVQFRTVNGPFSMKLEVFEEYIWKGILRVEI